MDRKDIGRNAEQPEERTFRIHLISQGLRLEEAQSRQVPFPVGNHYENYTPERRVDRNPLEF